MPDGPKKKPQQKAGQKRRRESDPEDTLALIDRLLMEHVRVSINGRIRRIPAIEAIMLQLMQKEMAGDKYASRVLLKYEKLALQAGERRLEIKFVDSDYTRAFGNLENGNGNG